MGGRNAFIFVWSSLLFSVVPLLFAFILPESPKFLHSAHDYEATKASLQRIAVLNGQSDEDFSKITLENA